MNGKVINEEGSESNVLSVTEYIPKNNRDGLQKPRCSTNLYVKNFSEDYTDDDLKK